jgi:polyisoprenoid-binding protein YceI
LVIAGIVVGVILLAVVVGPFVYIHFIQGSAPAKLTIDTSTTGGSGGTSTSSGAETKPLAGTWKVLSGSSTAGYRVDEVLFGQTTTAVGRTNDVTGQIQIVGTDVTGGQFTVGMTTIKSDQSSRDARFQGPIMDTAQFPHATFNLTAPIPLGKVPADGEIIHVPASGKLTLHGRTRTVTVPLSARRTGDVIQVSGSIPVVFADYDIANPSQSFVTTKDHGTVEFLLDLQHT